MALYGMRPVVEMQFDGFSYPALNQVISHVAKYRSRTRGRVGLPLVIRIPYGGGIGAVEHHSESPEAYYAHTAGLTVVSPGTPADAYALLRASIAFDDPVIFLEPKRRYWLKEDLDLPVTAPPIGKAIVRRPGTTATVIAYGPMVTTAMEAATRAAEESGLGPRGHRRPHAVAARHGHTGGQRHQDRTRGCGPRGRAVRGIRRGDRRGAERTRLRLPRGAGPARQRVGRALPRPPRSSVISFPTPTASSMPSRDCSSTDPVLTVRDFLMPDLGEGLTEGEINRWLVAEGDVVVVDQPIAEITTEKAVVEVPTPFAGRVAALHGAEGQSIAVGHSR